MVRARSFMKVALAVGLAGVVGCGASSSGDGLEKGIGMPNPAAVYCSDIGGHGRLEEDAEGNQHTICVLPDGSEVRAWELYCGDVYDPSVCRY